MFDNLKEKLGSFRKDAEEAAEANVEDVDEDELEDGDLEEPVDASKAEPAEPESEPNAEDGPAATAAATASDSRSGVESDFEDETAAGAGTESEREVAETTDAGAEPRADAPVAETDAAPVEDGAFEEEATTDEGSVESGLVGEEGDEFEDEEGLEDEFEDEESLEDEVEAETEVEAESGAEAETDADDTGGIGFGRKAKSLVRGKFVIEEEDLEGPLQELELALLSSDVEMGVVDEIVDNIREELVGETRTFTTSTGAVVEEALKDAIYDVISVGQFDFDERIAIEDRPVVIVFTGVNGVGKTTSIAKLDRYFEERGYSTVMANGDTYRAGANEQIGEHARARDTKLIAHDQGGDPAAVLYDAVEYAEANDIDVVLGDTAGRLHTNEGLMDQLEKIGRVVDPDMILFVDEAVAGQDAVNRAREFNAAAEIDGTILTKADADSNGGAAISVAHVTGKPILFLGVGQGYEDIERFDPDEMVERLLEE
ncbi:signal recognition particle-docking protein FtsY [Natronosalvus halobius]|uniref:signal recognition particle-docking protein FtsY n=1 Tax=Natronosalvus halobius TaxID=2953746 RepID=UPI0020A0E2BB|nr:signal recognition particle-docking protein FtsY [Natronosalvus halobius]USZ71023.1 signal recognition particle-docking protein FtsY [Natronosalvus halobius]